MNSYPRLYLGVPTKNTSTIDNMIYLQYHKDMIYVIKISNQPYYKIGLTNNKTMKQRLSALQSASPYIMEIYTTSVCHTSLEFSLHRALADYHLRGEWFELPITIANRLYVLMSELSRLHKLSDEDISDYLLRERTVRELKQHLSEVLF